MLPCRSGWLPAGDIQGQPSSSRLGETGGYGKARPQSRMGQMSSRPPINPAPFSFARPPRPNSRLGAGSSAAEASAPAAAAPEPVQALPRPVSASPFQPRMAFGSRPTSGTPARMVRPGTSAGTPHPFQRPRSASGQAAGTPGKPKLTPMRNTPVRLPLAGLKRGPEFSPAVGAAPSDAPSSAGGVLANCVLASTFLCLD
jgi:hypothetical protein